MDRMNWLDKLIVAAILILLAVLLQEGSKAESEWKTFSFDVGALSISDQPCTVPVVMEEWKRIRAQVKVQYDMDIGPPKQSRLLWQGKVYAGCYVVGPDNGHVYNIDSLGEKLMPTIPLLLFVPHEGALPMGATRL